MIWSLKHGATISSPGHRAPEELIFSVIPPVARHGLTGPTDLLGRGPRCGPVRVDLVVGREHPPCENPRRSLPGLR